MFVHNKLLLTALKHQVASGLAGAGKTVCSFAVRRVPRTRAFTTHSYRHVSDNAVTLEIFSWTMSRLGTRVEGT